MQGLLYGRVSEWLFSCIYLEYRFDMFCLYPFQGCDTGPSGLEAIPNRVLQHSPKPLWRRLSTKSTLSLPRQVLRIIYHSLSSILSCCRTNFCSAQALKFPETFPVNHHVSTALIPVYVKDDIFLILQIQSNLLTWSLSPSLIRTRASEMPSPGCYTP